MRQRQRESQCDREGQREGSTLTLQPVLMTMPPHRQTETEREIHRDTEKDRMRDRQTDRAGEGGRG